MESSRNSGSSVNLRTGNSTNYGEGEPFFNSENKQVPSSSTPFSPELTSQDHFLFMPNETTRTHPSPLGAASPTINDQTNSQLKMQYSNTNSLTEKGDRSPIYTHLEANPFGGAHHSPWVNNNSALTSSSSQDPFLVPSDAINTTQVSAIESEKLHDHLRSVPDMKNSGLSIYPFESSQGMAPSRNESSPANPFEVHTGTISKKSPTGASVSWKFDERHDQGNEPHYTSPFMEQGQWSMPSPNEARTQLSDTHGEVHVPSSSQNHLFPFESSHNQQVVDATNKNHVGATIPTNIESNLNFSGIEQEHLNSKASSGSHLRTDEKLGSSMSSFSQASESSTQDHKHNSINDVARNAPPKMGKDLQLDSETSDDYISSFPKHGQQSSDVTGQDSSHSSVSPVPGFNNGSEKQNPPVQAMERPEDATAASKYRFPSHVFARHKSNTQWSTASNESLFSIHMGNMSFSSEMALMNKSDELDKPRDTNSSSSGLNNQPLLPPQPQAPPTKFNDISQRTAEEHKSSKVTEEKAAETMRQVIMESSVKNQSESKVDLKKEETCPTDYSSYSNGSNKSFAFNVWTDGDKNISSRHGNEEKRKQPKPPEQQTLEEPPDAAQNPNPAPNASQNKWMCCFPCCG